MKQPPMLAASWVAAVNSLATIGGDSWRSQEKVVKARKSLTRSSSVRSDGRAGGSTPPGTCTPILASGAGVYLQRGHGHEGVDDKEFNMT